MKRIIKFIRQLFCWHNWEAQGNMFNHSAANPPTFKCSKCGREEGL